MTNTPLKKILFERGLKNKWLAKESEIEEAGCSLIVNGKRVPTLVVALKIAKVLEVSVEELWGHLIIEEQ